MVPHRGILGDELYDRGINFIVFQVDRGNAVLAGQNLGDFVVTNESQFHQRGSQPTPVLPLMGDSLLKLIGGNQVFFDQDFAKPGRHNESLGGTTRLKLEK